MTLADAVDELYGLDPAHFTAHRTRLAGAAKTAGDARLAAEIRALRKPVTAAWLINRLSRSSAGELAELSDLGSRFRTAQQNLRGELLRGLSEERQRLLNRLVARATEADDGSTAVESPLVASQLRQSFEAALADPAAEEAVRSGRLITPLSYSGFGEIDLSAAVVSAPAQPRHLQLVHSPDPAAPAASANAAADVVTGPTLDSAQQRRAVDRERRAAAAARAAAAVADEHRRREAAGRLSAAEHALREIDRRVATLHKELDNAETLRHEAARRVATAQAELAQAESAQAAPPVAGLETSV